MINPWNFSLNHRPYDPDIKGSAYLVYNMETKKFVEDTELENAHEYPK
jgi:hypothetical protein